MNSSKGILFFVFVLSFHLANGQAAGSGNASPGLRLPADTARLGTGFYQLPSLSLLPSRRPSEPAAYPVLRVAEIPAAWSYDALGAFCKWEIQLEKAARLPVKVRLGEVQYVERMEGKLPDH